MKPDSERNCALPADGMPAADPCCALPTHGGFFEKVGEEIPRNADPAQIICGMTPPDPDRRPGLGLDCPLPWAKY